jgi:hypothetical protein
MAELGLNLSDGGLYFGPFSFVPDQCSPKKSFIVCCHAVESSPLNFTLHFVVASQRTTLL